MGCEQRWGAILTKNAVFLITLFCRVHHSNIWQQWHIYSQMKNRQQWLVLKTNTVVDGSTEWHRYTMIHNDTHTPYILVKYNTHASSSLRTIDKDRMIDHHANHAYFRCRWQSVERRCWVVREIPIRSAKSWTPMACLPVLKYYFDGRECGWYNWNVIINKSQKQHV